jgi:hypothetical protein
MKLTLTPQLSWDDIATLRRAAIAGVVSLPDFVVQPDLATGQLVSILPGWVTRVAKVGIITLPRSQTSRLTAVFSEFLMRDSPHTLGLKGAAPTLSHSQRELMSTRLTTSQRLPTCGIEVHNEQSVERHSGAWCLG